MGNFLDTPITEKETEVGEDQSKGFCYGLSAMQGWRSHMEDDHVQLLTARTQLSKVLVLHCLFPCQPVLQCCILSL